MLCDCHDFRRHVKDGGRRPVGSEPGQGPRSGRASGDRGADFAAAKLGEPSSLRRFDPCRILGGIERTRSEEHTSELQSLMRISYAVFCLKKKNINYIPTNTHNKTLTKKTSKKQTHTNKT